MVYLCVVCTYSHYMIVERCKMCGSIQHTKEDRANFIKGKPTAKKKQLLQLEQGGRRTPTPPVPHRTKQTSLTGAVVRPPIDDKARRRIEENKKKAKEKRDMKKREVELSKRNAQQAQYNMSKNNRANPYSKPSSVTPNSVNPFTTAAAQKYEEGPVPINKETMMTYIYPTNYEVREYQREMTKTALFNNTIICLPTGLGKTMIASCVMYNFDRWFPSGIIIFMAPTKPLVEQQIGSCYRVTGLPESRTAVMNGDVDSRKRSAMWNTRNFFFCTPQTVQNDLKRNAIPVDRVTCVIIDEAHKASGEYAYVKVLRLIDESKARYRIVGLSATPGQNKEKINEVIRNLRAAKMEYRTEEDVKEYINKKEIEVIDIEQPTAVKEGIQCIDACLKSHLIVCEQEGLISREFSGMATSTPYVAIRARERWAEKNEGNNARIWMYNGHFEVLRRLFDMKGSIATHGIRMCMNKLIDFERAANGGNFMKEFKKSVLFIGMANKLKEIMKQSQSVQASQESMDDATILTKNDPKMTKLVEVLNDHFKKFAEVKSDTRAIVFSQWRESVALIESVLKQHSLLKPKAFVGQASTVGKADGMTHKGMNQDEQQQAIDRFRTGRYNVLVCTSIGEEGLDIGEVDLIVNIDSLSSSIRTTQRAGRTGRKRDGRVVFLISEGAERNRYDQSINKAKKMNEQMKNQLKNYQFTTQQYSLFPREANAREVQQHIEISQDFRSSQVGGNTPRQKKRRKSVLTRDWKLTFSQEKARVEIYGSEEQDSSPDDRIWSLGNWKPGDERGRFPNRLKKRLLSKMSFDAHEGREKYGAMPVSSKAQVLKVLNDYVSEDGHGDDEMRRIFNVGTKVVRNNNPIERRWREEEDEGEMEDVEEEEESETWIVKNPRDNSSSNDLFGGNVGEVDDREMHDDLEFGMNDDDDDYVEGNFVHDPNHDHRGKTESGEGLNYEDLTTSGSHHTPHCINSGGGQKVIFLLKDEAVWGESNFILSGVKVENYEREHPNINDGKNEEVDKIAATSGGDDGAKGDEIRLNSDGSQENNNPNEGEPSVPPTSSFAQWDCARCTLKNDKSRDTCSACQTPRFRKPASKATKQQTLSFGALTQANVKSKSKSNFKINLNQENADDSSSSGSSDEDGESESVIMEKQTSKPPHPPPKNFEITLGVDESSSSSSEDEEDDEEGRMTVPERTNVKKSSAPSRNFEVTYVPSSQSSASSSSSSDDDNEEGNKKVLLHQHERTPQTSRPQSALKQTQDSSEYLVKRANKRVLFDDSQSTTLTFQTFDESNVVCEVCLIGDSTKEDPILYCEGKEGNCSVIVHKSCYGVNHVPEGKFLCHVCSEGPTRSAPKCSFCNVSDGSALSKTLDDDFVHPVCMWWNREYCSMADKSFDVKKVKDTCLERQKVLCEFCNRGGATQCMYGDCLRAAHPHCGRSAHPQHLRWLLRTRDVDDVEGTRFEIFCDEHHDLVEGSKGDISKFTDFGWDAQLIGGDRDGGITLTQCMEESEEEGEEGGLGRLRKKNKNKKRKKGNEGDEAWDGRKKKPRKELIKDLSIEEKIAKLGKLKRLERGKLEAKKYMDIEAGCDEESVEFREGDDDSAGSLADFINDGSDVGSLRCSLDYLDRDNLEEEGVLHRQLDAINEPTRFTTPILKRRRSVGSERSSYGSDQGLGQMHFIRSVVDHHNKGGIADDVEDEYLRIEELGDGGAGGGNEEDEEAVAWRSPEDDDLDSSGGFGDFGNSKRASGKTAVEGPTANFSIPKKGSIVLLNFPGGDVYKSKVTNGKIENDVKGNSCIRVESIKVKNGKPAWHEFVLVTEWEERYRAPDDQNMAFDEEGKLRRIPGGSIRPPKPLQRPSTWVGGGGGVKKGTTTLTQEQIRMIERKKEEAARRRKEKMGERKI